MTPRAKNIYHKSIKQFNDATDYQKSIFIRTIEDSLKSHYEGLKNIGIGFDRDMVSAGEVFLRINKG